MSDINRHRSNIDEIDRKMAELFQQRMEEVQAVVQYKKENGLNVTDRSRERQVIEKHLPQIDEKWQKYYVRFMQDTFATSRQFQTEYLHQNESMLKNEVDFSDYTDNAFKAAQRARQALKEGKPAINATIGSLYGSDNAITAFKSVYDVYNAVSNRRKASYAGGIQGNADYNEAVFNWLNRLDNISLPHRSVATPGGTGAICLPVFNCLNHRETLIIPEIAWGSYRLMARQNECEVITYAMFENGKASINGITKVCREVMDQQHKVVIVINDPCQNPTGISLGSAKWEELIDFFNELSKDGEVVIINDIAYLDFARDCDRATEYMAAFNKADRKVTILIAFSCSKSLTAYGMRLGDLIILNKDPEKVSHLYNGFLRTARSFWSNVNNGFMDCFTVLMTEHQSEYRAEKQRSITELYERAQLFIKQAAECGLPLYPFREGFFITLRIDEDIKQAYYERLMENDIYCVVFPKGIRIAICSLPLEVIDGLAYRLASILSEIRDH